MGALDTLYETSEELAEFLEEASSQPLKDNKGKKITIKSCDEVSRPQLTKIVWSYVKHNGLQDGKFIDPDDVLEPVLGSKKVSMFQLQKLLNDHLFLEDDDE